MDKCEFIIKKLNERYSVVLPVESKDLVDNILSNYNTSGLIAKEIVTEVNGRKGFDFDLCDDEIKEEIIDSIKSIILNRLIGD